MQGDNTEGDKHLFKEGFQGIPQRNRKKYSRYREDYGGNLMFIKYTVKSTPNTSGAITIRKGQVLINKNRILWKYLADQAERVGWESELSFQVEGTSSGKMQWGGG